MTGDPPFHVGWPRGLVSWPIRARLTLWYTTVLAAVLLGGAAVSYSLLGGLVDRQAEQALAETARTVMVSLRVVGASTPPARRAEVLAAAAARFRYPDRRVLIFDGESLVTASPPPEERGGRGPYLVRVDAPELLRAIREGRRNVLLAPPSPDSGPIRAHIGAPPRGRGRFAVVVLASTRRDQEFLEAVRAYFMIFIPLAILIAALIGYFLAGRSLAPVGAITRQAERLGASNLDERLPVANPRDELGRLAGVLNSLLARLHAAFEQQRRFMADAAHELRTPVAVIRGEAEVTLARPRREEAEYRDSLKVVAGESARLSDIVDDLFTLARADAGQYPLRREPLYLDELLTDTARAISTLAARKRIDVAVDAPEELPFAGDEALLRRMLTNLLDNAVKYTPQGGRIAASARREGDRYRLSVSDTGPGIPASDRDRIFERFHRVEPPTEAAADRDSGGTSGGAGLGLPIARWIAEAHGGSLVLAASSDAGSTFTAELPAPPLEGVKTPELSAAESLSR